MGFKVSVFINSSFATSAENRALRDLVSRLRSISLPPNDPFSGEGADIWVLVEPQLFTNVGANGTRSARPDLVIIKRNSILVVEMKHWWGELAIPSALQHKDELWDSRAPGGFSFLQRKPNPLAQLEYTADALKTWLIEKSHEFPNHEARTSNWNKISRALLFTHPELRIASSIPEYFQTTLVTSLHRVPHTRDIVEEIANTASGLRDHKRDPIPNVMLDEADVRYIADRLELSHWDPFAQPMKRFLGPEGIISHWWPGKRQPDKLEVTVDTSVVALPEQLRILEFHRRRLIAEAKANPDINLSQDGKHWAKHFTLKGKAEEVMSFGRLVQLNRSVLPNPLKDGAELAYGLFWNVRTDDQTGLHSASPLFYIGCSLIQLDSERVELAPANPGCISLNIDLLRTFLPFSMMEDDEVLVFQSDYEKLAGFERVQFVIDKIEGLPALDYEQGMELVSDFPANADLLHAGIAFIPERMMTKRIIDDLSMIRASWQSSIAEGRTPNDLAWKMLSPRPDLGSITVHDHCARTAHPLNYEQTQVLSAARDTSTSIVVVQGPPGTGKTRVLASIATDCVATQRSLLVTSANNTAVSNVVEQLNSQVSYPAVFSIGSVKTVTAFSETLSEFQAKQCSELIDAIDSASSEELAHALREQDSILRDIGQQLDEYYRCTERLADVEETIKQHLTDHPQLAFLDVNDVPFALDCSSNVRILADEYTELVQAGTTFVGRLRELFRGRVGLRSIFTRQSFLSAVSGWLTTAAKTRIAAGWDILVTGVFVPPHGETMRANLDSYILNSDLRTTLATFVSSTDETSLRSAFEACQVQRSKLCCALLRNAHRRRRCRDANAYIEYTSNSSSTMISRIAENLSPLACTLHSLPKYYEKTPGSIDIVAIDESSQCSIGIALPALFRAKKAVIVGDLMQLQPVFTLSEVEIARIAVECGVDSDDYAIWINPSSSLQSVAEYHIEQAGANRVFRLSEHHRSLPPIIQFSNSEFYQGKLIIRRQDDSSQSILQWIDHRGNESDKVNQSEAREVIKVVKKLLEDGSDPNSIGIVTPFSHQRHELTDLFIAMIGSETLGGKESSGVMIDTVHGFQGSECHTMVMSPVITLNSKPGRIRWVTSGTTAASLINVSVTRATDRLIIVGDSRAATGYLGNLLRWVEEYSSRV
jgi:hypothetical protein